MKKEYNAPSIRSIKINEPLAYACNVYNMSQCCGGTWSGCNFPTDMHIICN
jgi:hypothetical protein